ncbi:hypothetical protein BKA70DRAFT_1097562 [Coprinopsis sp. MPI-PUGE-AT-0042]|nr:hypothetical protein BKA70DRAFT_1097562 [Coprinopsis sp. MPI-PUGE-AT-0042]
MVASLQQIKRPEMPSMPLDDFALGQNIGYGPQSDSALTAHSDRSAESEFNWPSNPTASTPTRSESPIASPTQPEAPPADPPKTKKHRREKPRIELAPDQPPTTQGKPRSRVYVACVQCRTRKIRCDGAKPQCHNCGRRSTGCNDCVYDPVPKRRGPDKCPGARQRMARSGSDAAGSRRRRRTARSTSQASESTPGDSDSHQEPSSALEPLSLSHPHPATADQSVNPQHSDFASVQSYGRQYSPECGCHGLVHCPDLFELTDSRKPSAMAAPASAYAEVLNNVYSVVRPNQSRAAYITELTEGRECSQAGEVIATQPSLNYARKVWWDSLLCLYASGNGPLHAISSSDREATSHKVSADLRWIFRASNYWFSFFHISSFFGNFYDPQRREQMQPSLVLGLLAISTFFQSSEVGGGRQGRERAIRFREEAQAALDASFNSGWIDETLAQAAWLLAFFEVCAHPRHKGERSKSSLLLLDAIIRSLSLTFVDADDPDTSLFPPGSVPVVANTTRTLQHTERQQGPWFPEPVIASFNAGPSYPTEPPEPSVVEESAGCNCQSMTLGEHWPYVVDHAPMWGNTPAWDGSWGEGDMRKESIRRLCWSSTILAANHNSYTMAHRSQSLDLFIADPANYALLFSGESLARSPHPSQNIGKQTIWALFDRAFLLWHGCIKMRNNNKDADMDKAHFAVKAWLEADALEHALNKHTCAIERSFIFQAREYIFNIRMCISYEFKRYIPLVSGDVSGLFHRKKAEEWLTHQAEVAQRFMLGLHTVTGNSNNLLARRPFFVFWFMGQISRSLSLWHCDNSLTLALDACKSLLPPTEYLTALWPCTAEQRLIYESLRDKLEQACFIASVPPPRPPNYKVPSMSAPALV